MSEYSDNVVYQITVRIFKGDEHQQDIERLKETIERNFQVFFPIVIGTAEAKITEIKKIEKEKDSRTQSDTET